MSIQGNLFDKTLFRIMPREIDLKAKLMVKQKPFKHPLVTVHKPTREEIINLKRQGNFSAQSGQNYFMR